MTSPVVDKVIKQLKKANLSLEDRTALTAVLLNKLNALPLRSSIIVTPRGITINGKKMEPEDMIALREGTVALRDNKARQLINEQIRFLAVKLGIHDALSMDTIMFSKAALWVIEQEDKLISDITGE